MTSTEFDPAAYKDTQRSRWNAASGGWRAWSGLFERGAASVTAKLLELGGVGPGRRVLDVATGQGEPALTAARLVAPGGHVVGVDISPGMLAVARERAAGLPNVEFVEADLESLDRPAGSFDVVLSRFGLMLAVDHVASFKLLARLLVPGGVLAAAVWGPPSNSLFGAGPAALSQYLGLPPPSPDVPGPYAMSDPRRTQEELAAAGFQEVSVTEHTVPFQFDSLEEYLRYTRETMQPASAEAVRQRFGSVDAPEAWEVVAAAVRPHLDAQGVLRLPSLALLLRAVRPG